MGEAQGESRGGVSGVEGSPPSLGIAMILRLPPQPGQRAQPVRLPPPRVSLAGRVPLVEAAPTESAYAMSTPSMQAGRGRLTALLTQGLRWGEGQPLTSEQAWFDSSTAHLPTLLLQPARKGTQNPSGDAAER